MYEGRMEFVAKKTPGVVVEWGSRGVFEGVEGARRCFVEVEKLTEQSHGAGMRTAFPEVDFKSDAAGNFASKLSGSSVVEVAQDGETAKGVWTTLSVVARAHDFEGGKKPVPRWVWARTSIDFVKEDGEWKIWHMIENPYWVAAFNEDWVVPSRTLGRPIPAVAGEKGDHGGNPDRAPTRAHDGYTITREPRLWPEPPKPYETFDPKDAYLG
jgi:hypothetical protein